nr:transcriptional regulator, LuxR family [Streptomyces sp.]
MSWASRRDYAAEFGELLAEAGPHQGAVMALHGGPGTGKTTLLRRFREHAAECGALYLAATGFRNESGVPFATIEQLTHSSGLPAEARAAVHRLWEDGVPREASDSGHVERMRDLTSALETAARKAPLVVAIDDTQYADELSRACLLHLARRAQNSGIIMVVTFGQALCEGHADRTEEFLLVPGCRVGEIAPLPKAEVRRLLEGKLGAGTAEEVLAAVHRVSGGSPALVHALIRDYKAARKARPEPGAAGEEDAVVGKAFEWMYVARLKHHPQLLAYVRALAVLGPHATPARLGQLLDRGPERLAMEMRELELAGLLEDGGFRHPAARRAVLKALGGDERAGLHLRAAGVLQAEGVSVTTVAEHLVAGGEIPDDAGVAVLLRASRQLLAEGKVDASLRCLRLADRAELAEPRRVEVDLGLLGALWCVNPAAAEPEVSRLMSAMRAGALGARAVHALVAWLLWFGRTKEAGEAITQLEKSYDPRDPRAREQLTATRATVAHLSPALLPDLPESDSPSGIRDTMSAAFLEYAAHMSLGSSRVPVGDNDLLVLDGDETDTDCAGTLLPPVPGARYSWDRDAITLLELLQHGDLSQAERLGAALLARLPGEGSPARHAIFRSVHAYIALQRGEMATAVTRAATALEQLPDHGWGVIIGSPLATLVHAHIAMGRCDEAARYLEYPVPEEMFHSTIGLFYLVARGYHSLATGRPYAALNDFTACAPLGEKWHSRSRHLLGWRTGAAEAYVALDEPARARTMVERELADIGPRPSRFRGNALRVLAATSPPDQREALLREAVRILRLSDNRLALARALADLGRSHLDNGHVQESRAAWEEAQRLGHQPEARTSPWMTWTPSQPRTASDLPAVSSTSADKPLLSDAERRVAALASEGKSNRQIARHLYITVSTVEQHLTRVYRKLSVRRRAELSQFLSLLTNGMDFPAD